MILAAPFPIHRASRHSPLACTFHRYPPPFVARSVKRTIRLRCRRSSGPAKSAAAAHSESSIAINDTDVVLVPITHTANVLAASSSSVSVGRSHVTS